MHRIPLLLFCTWAWVVVLAAKAYAVPRSPHLAGTPLIRVWRAGDYEAAPANWKIVMHPTTGFVYVANDAGVLEFDGATWRRIPLPNESPARSLAADREGRLWVGGHNTVCRLEPDHVGRLRAVPQLDALPRGVRPEGNVSYLAATTEGVFASNGNARQLFLFGTTGTPNTWSLAADEPYVWTLRDSPESASGTLVQLSSDGLVPVFPRPMDGVSRRGPRFGLFASRREANGQWFLLTARGPARTLGVGHPLVFEPAGVRHPFAEDPATAGAILSDGRLVLATERAGLLVCDPAGEIIQRLDRTHGLPTNRIEGLTADAADGLWIAFADGVARIDFRSPIARHHAPQGVNATPLRFAAFDRQLYLAHEQGLSQRDDVTGIFSPVAGFVTKTTGLVDLGGRLLAGARGLREVLPGPRGHEWLSDDLGPMVPHPHQPGTLLAGTPTGLVLLAPDERGGWKIAGKFSAIDQAIDQLHVTANFVWAAGRLGALYRIDFATTAGLDAPIRVFAPADGWPGVRLRTPPRFVTFNGALYIAGGAGLRRYDAAASRFILENRLDALGVPPSTGVDAIAVAEGKLWLLFAPPARRLMEISAAPDGIWRGTTVADTVGALLTTPVSALFAEPDTRTLWILSRDALLSLALDRPTPPVVRAPRVFIRRVTSLPDGHVLYDGDGAPAPWRLAPAQRSLRFTYAAPEFAADAAGQTHVLYRTRLDGVDETWSAWESATSREFTNLPAGELELHVQARAADGRESAAETQRFSRAAPWWETTWARLGYALFAAVAVASLVLERTRVARRRAAHLEAIVAARTAEIARLRQIDRDESAAAKLAEEKTRLEMLRYQLNPHFLYNALNSIRALIFSRPPAAGDMVTQLADLCRVTLTRNEDRAPVSEEFAMLKLYLDMEKTRWRDKLALEIDLAPDAAAQPIPPFLLLPLVENALKHGRQSTAGVMKLRLVARLEKWSRGAPAAGNGENAARAPRLHNAETLLLEVANTGIWLEPGQSIAPSTGIGLENLRQRLKRYYPGAHELTTVQEDGEVVVRLRLPRETRIPQETVDRTQQTVSEPRKNTPNQSGTQEIRKKHQMGGDFSSD